MTAAGSFEVTGGSVEFENVLLPSVGLSLFESAVKFCVLTVPLFSSGGRWRNALNELFSSSASEHHLVASEAVGQTNSEINVTIIVLWNLKFFIYFNDITFVQINVFCRY